LGQPGPQHEGRGLLCEPHVRARRGLQRPDALGNRRQGGLGRGPGHLAARALPAYARGPAKPQQQPSLSLSRHHRQQPIGDFIMADHPALKPGNVAVITGGASGIGLAAAKKYASFGMKICLADRNEDQLWQAVSEVSELTLTGADDVLAVAVDVSDMSQMEGLRENVYTTFGRVNVLMNNAGIGARAGSWDGYENWQKTLNTNLWGVINGVQAFTAAMLAQNTPGLIVNTGSKQGITCPPGNTPYNVSRPQ